MCQIANIKDKIVRFIKSTSPFPSTEDKIIMFQEHFKASQLELQKGIRVGDYISDNEFKLPCYMGSGIGKSIIDTTEISICTASYKSGTVTDKHHHKLPTVEDLTVISGRCIVYFLNKDGDTVVKKFELTTGMKLTVPEGVKHIVTFEKDTEILVVTIPKDKFKCN